MDSRREGQIADPTETQGEPRYWSLWILMPLAALLGFPGGYSFVEMYPSRSLLYLLPLACIPVAVIGARIRSLLHTVLFALAYSLGDTVLPFVEGLLRPDCFWNATGASVLGAFLFVANAFLCATVWWFIWGRPRKMKAKRRFLCDNCSYSLIGNTSGVCPECGTPIPFEAKGITPEQLKMLARPDDSACGDSPS